LTLLPFLEQQALHGKFHLDEPWDSPHNLTPIDQVPAPFICPSQAGWSRKQAIYQALDGPGAFLDASKPSRISEIGDGTSEPIAIVEGSTPVP
jgi:hypothetical protein